jgi:hypothetical protein
VSFIAEPTPAFSRGSEPMIDSVAGARIWAKPTASTHMISTTLIVGESAVNGVMRSRPNAAIDMPVAITILLPKRWTHRGESGARIISTIACGNRTAPALSVE